MNVAVYNGIAHEDHWAGVEQVDMFKAHCWKRGYTVSGVVAEFFGISRARMKLICGNIK